MKADKTIVFLMIFLNIVLIKNIGIPNSDVLCVVFSLFFIASTFYILLYLFQEFKVLFKGLKKEHSK